MRKSKELLEWRNKANFFGGRALRGTLKQKEWAEEIRAEKIQCMSLSAIKLICDPNGLCTHSTFWITNRGKSAAEFEIYITSQKALLAKYRKACVNNDQIKAVQYAQEYNELVAKWHYVK